MNNLPEMGNNFHEPEADFNSFMFQMLMFLVLVTITLVSAYFIYRYGIDNKFSETIAMTVAGAGGLAAGLFAYAIRRYVAAILTFSLVASVVGYFGFLIARFI